MCMPAGAAAVLLPPQLPGQIPRGAMARLVWGAPVLQTAAGQARLPHCTAWRQVMGAAAAAVAAPHLGVRLWRQGGLLLLGPWLAVAAVPSCSACGPASEPAVRQRQDRSPA